MDVHQCPRCELRFANTSELRHHFQFDHAADPSVFEPYRYRSREAPAAQRTILLVGNQTLDREGLVDEVAARAADGARVLVLVPATPVAHHDEPVRAEDAGGDDAGVTLARWRLATAVDNLRAAGIDADGEIGGPDPYAAVCAVLGDEDVDEILLSTLPPSSSRWLQVDLPGRLRRHTGRPVTLLSTAPAATGPA